MPTAGSYKDIGTGPKYHFILGYNILSAGIYTMSKSLKDLWKEAGQSKAQLDKSTLRRDSPAYAELYDSTLAQFAQCHAVAQQLGLFSSNESNEDLGTSDLEYLATPYQLAAVLDRAPLSKRAGALVLAKQYYLEFLTCLDNYKLIPQAYSQRLRRIQNKSKPDPVLDRAFKVESFKFQQQLKQQISTVDFANIDNLDDEVARKVQFARLGIYVVEALNALPGIEPELEMLKQMEAHKKNVQQSESRPQQESIRVEQVSQDPKFKPLLTPQGKVNRPFTIVSHRDQLKKSVFGSGQYLPTMSVEEYLEEEMKRGGIISGGGPQQEDDESSGDEDDMDKHDLETMKKRQWDEFVEANPKGSGNTLNLG